MLKIVDFPLIGFIRSTIYPLGSITLSVVLGDRSNNLKLEVSFIVVVSLTFYNAILGRTTIDTNKITPP